jgi:hypothetical protein
MDLNCVDPRRTLFVALGAHYYPDSILTSSTSLLKASDKVVKYFLAEDGFGLPHENHLNLFDAPSEPNSQDRQIASWIAERSAALELNGTPATDLILYYVGHGGLDDNDRYYLALKTTRDSNRGISSLKIDDLGPTITSSARTLRTYLIIDACFSGKTSVLLSESVDTLKAQIKERFVHPTKGVAMLCSSDRDRVSKIVEERETTMFSEAFHFVLTQGDGTQSDYFSLRVLNDRINQTILDLNGINSVRSSVYSPRQPEGDIADIPLFPNAAGRIRQAEARRRKEEANRKKQEEERERQEAERQREKREAEEQAALECKRQTEQKEREEAEKRWQEDVIAGNISITEEVTNVLGRQREDNEKKARARAETALSQPGIKTARSRTKFPPDKTRGTIIWLFIILVVLPTCIYIVFLMFDKYVTYYNFVETILNGNPTEQFNCFKIIFVTKFLDIALIGISLVAGIGLFAFSRKTESGASTALSLLGGLILISLAVALSYGTYRLAFTWSYTEIASNRLQHMPDKWALFALRAPEYALALSLLILAILSFAAW